MKKQNEKTKIELENIQDEKVKIKIKKLNPNAIIPKYSHVGDAGMDLFSIEDLILKPKHRALIKTGLSIELPKGYVSLVWDKSGIALKGIKTMGGVIEHTYRGEYKIILVNLSSEDYEIKKGQKIAQLLIQKIETAEVEEVNELSETIRGTGGFGSTGK
ncbi:dUTP diphosphatase [Candidatus Pacearchaeota archaeon]|jgi:dUTP pyrophosphatase|nr:dUTP diphosphatase [Candidatus Pacearchaeota archaeon]